MKDNIYRTVKEIILFRPLHRGDQSCCEMLREKGGSWRWGGQSTIGSLREPGVRMHSLTQTPEEGRWGISSWNTDSRGVLWR